MKQLVFISLAIICLSASSRAVNVSESLYINSDSLETVDNLKLPYYCFNTSSVFAQENHRIVINIGDTLELWVYNTDTLVHHFDIDGLSGLRDTIQPGDSINISYQFNIAGAYIYYDPKAYPNNYYSGLAGMIVVKDHAHASFYWNTKEHDESFHNDLANGIGVNWLNYNPKYFTINGLSHPDIMNDTIINVQGNVGDTLMLYIANTGRGMRSIHFHGYHGEIVFSSKYPTNVGRSKDTFPVSMMEATIIRIVPDKPGIYPVHEHNLVAVTGNNYYPNGMFTLMNIQP